MVGNARTLNFTASELGKKVQLLLMFDLPKTGTPYVDLFPVCWKVITLQPTGISGSIIEYTADTGLLVPQVNTGNLVSASNAQRCETGQMCTLLTTDDGSGNYLTPAVAGNDGIIQCVIDSERPADISIGFFNKAGSKIEPVLMWTEVGKGSTLNAQLTPVLKIYAVTDYQATQLIRADIHSELLFEEDLIALPSFTEWVVSIDKANKAIKIDRA